MAKGVKRTEEEALLWLKPVLPLLQRGMSEEQACAYAKISEATLNIYKKKFKSVYSEISTAKMHMIAVASNTVGEAIKTDPQLALKVLEKRSKKYWGNTIDITTDGEKIVPTLVEFINKPVDKIPDNTED